MLNSLTFTFKLLLPLSNTYSKVKSSQIYLYSTFHNTDCIKAASQYQSKQLKSVCLFMKKKTIKFGRADQWHDGSFNSSSKTFNNSCLIFFF